MDDEVAPYGWEADAGRFHVRDDAGRVVMTCHDEASAVHYVVLLTEAYRRGFKCGSRRARKSPGAD